LALGWVLIASLLPATAATAGGQTCAGKTATIVGTSGDDELRGTRRDDVIVGLGGDDLIVSGPGRDLICGGGGNDALADGSGPDVLIGGAGNDLLVGMKGDDRLRGGSGAKDALSFYYYDSGVTADAARRSVRGAGRDRFGGIEVIEGTTHGDRLLGSKRRDVLFGGEGGDRIEGRGGPDILIGGKLGDVLDDHDLIYGEGGKDKLYGGGDSNSIYGGAQADRIFLEGEGGSGFGDGGNDLVVAANPGPYAIGAHLNGGSGKDTLVSRSGWDYLEGQGGADLVSGRAGNDHVNGGLGDDVLEGGPGDDTFEEPDEDSGYKEGTDPGFDTISYAHSKKAITADQDEVHGEGVDTHPGEGEIDRIVGSPFDDHLSVWLAEQVGLGGNDQLFGADFHEDVLYGGGGDDELHGWGGDDRLSGGAGNDRVSAGDDNDLITGNGGNDDLRGEAGDDVIGGGADTDVADGGLGLDECTAETQSGCENLGEPVSSRPSDVLMPDRPSLTTTDGSWRRLLRKIHRVFDGVALPSLD
jgi:Ca2+-binding RTX toxin-like protein